MADTGDVHDELVQLKQKEVTDSQKIKELEHQNVLLNKQLAEKEEQLVSQQKDKMDSSKNLIAKQEDLLNKIKDKLMCPVCLDIPRHGPVFLCHNGHLVCQKCKRESCPMCRTDMGHAPVKSLLASIILDNIDHKCKFDKCIELFAKETIEKHEMVCCHRTINCPRTTCTASVSLSELVGHLLKSENSCSSDQKVTRVHGDWLDQAGFSMGDFSKDDAGDINWRLRIYSYRGEHFVVFPLKSGGYFYFVIAMLAVEAKCSKLKFEMIIHGSEMNPLDSEVSVKYQGRPLSIDLKKEELKLFGTSQQFMAKLIETSVDKKSFSISFKLS